MELVACLIMESMSHFYAFITTIGKVAGGKHSITTASRSLRHFKNQSEYRTSTHYRVNSTFFSFNGDGFGQLPGKTARTHQYAKVANYQGQPFVVGGSESGNKYS